MPQPQDFLALGFEKTKPLPFNPSEKSRVVPARNINDFLGTLTSISC